MTTKRFRPTLVALESRFTPAGNVTAQLVGGALVVTGDAADNAVVLTQTAAGSFTVTGAAGTTVNGGTAAVTLAGVTRDVRFRMGDGADSVTLGSASIETIAFPRSLDIDGGAGNNAVVGTASLSVGRDLLVSNRTGDDSATFTGRLAVTGDAIIANGRGASTVVIDPAAGLGSNVVGRSLLISGGGGGTASVTVADTAVSRAVAVDAYFSTNATVSLAGVTSRDLGVATGAGADTVSIAASTFSGAVGIYTDGGNDTVSATGTAFNGPVGIGLGRGDDSLNLATSVTVRGPAFFDGGAGSDRLVSRPAATGRWTTFARFELTGPAV